MACCGQGHVTNMAEGHVTDMAVDTKNLLPPDLKTFLDNERKTLGDNERETLGDNERKTPGTCIILPSSLSTETYKVLEKQLNRRWKPHGAYVTKPRLLKTPLNIDGAQVWVVHGSFETPVNYTAGNDGWIERVVNLVCQVGKALHFLILGEAEGLENDLERDVAIIAHQAGLDFPTTLAVKEGISTLAVKDGISEIFNDKGAFVLLNTPDKQALEKKMTEHLTAVPSVDVNIYYSGHAFEDGSWFLSEDCSYTGEDLCQFIESCQQNKSRRFGGDLKVYLDSCYGLSFAKAVGMTDEKWSGFLESLKMMLKPNKSDEESELELPQDPELRTGARTQKKHWLDQVIEWAISRPELESEQESEQESKQKSELLEKYDKEVKRYEQANKFFTKCIVECLKGKKEFRYFPSKSITKDDLPMYFIPFSISELDPSGVLMDLYKPKISESLQKYLESLKSSNVGRGRSYVQLQRAKENLLDAANDPTIYCFPAGCGDSTLFRFKGVNILIDGGISKTEPCFWPVVSRLPINECLDVVILTHQDIDHLSGIERLIRTLPDDAFVKQLYCLDPPPENAPVSKHATKGGIIVWKAAKEKNCAKALRIGEKIDIPDIDENFKITLQLLAPTEVAATKARSWMKRSLTPPNQASAVVYLAVLDTQDNILCNALFTGDAPSSAVLDGMKAYKIPKTITYVDVPHHGSKENKPELLFNDDFTCQVACISTNGKQYFHPDVSTLDHLVKQFEKKKITNMLLFTYCDHAYGTKRNKRMESVKDYFKSKPNISVCMAHNKCDVSPPAHCLKVTLKLDPAEPAVVKYVHMYNLSGVFESSDTLPIPNISNNHSC